MTPVYFGAALKGFGVRELLQELARVAPSPRPQPAQTREVSPSENEVTGFVFKVQANMDPNHRDRVAFVRLVSGRFRRGMKLKQSGTGKQLSVHNPILFFAQEREVVDEAWPGDIIGIPNHGVLRVGDTLSESEALAFTGIPNFAPEILRRVRLNDVMKAKHLKRALESLAEEGVTQVFKPLIGAQWTVGVVGNLQLDVLKSRLQSEYGLDADLEASPYETARWVDGTPEDVEKFRDANKGQMAEDRDGAPVFLAKSNWELGYVGGKFPKIRFLKTRERSAAAEAA
jgi:peptide chain release factor 3